MTITQILPSGLVWPFSLTRSGTVQGFLNEGIRHLHLDRENLTPSCKTWLEVEYKEIGIKAPSIDNYQAEVFFR